MVYKPATSIPEAVRRLDDMLSAHSTGSRPLPDAIVFDHQLAPDHDGAPFTIIRQLLADPRWAAIEHQDRPKLVYVSSTFDPLLAHVWVAHYGGDQAADKRTWRRVVDAVDAALQGTRWTLVQHVLTSTPGARVVEFKEAWIELLPYLDTGRSYDEIAVETHWSVSKVMKDSSTMFDALQNIGALGGKHNAQRGRDIARAAVQAGIGFIPLDHTPIR